MASWPRPERLAGVKATQILFSRVIQIHLFKAALTPEKSSHVVVNHVWLSLLENFIHLQDVSALAQAFVILGRQLQVYLSGDHWTGRLHAPIAVEGQSSRPPGWEGHRGLGLHPTDRCGAGESRLLQGRWCWAHPAVSLKRHLCSHTTLPSAPHVTHMAQDGHIHRTGILPKQWPWQWESIPAADPLC